MVRHVLGLRAEQVGQLLLAAPALVADCSEIAAFDQFPVRPVQRAPDLVRALVDDLALRRPFQQVHLVRRDHPGQVLRIMAFGIQQAEQGPGQGPFQAGQEDIVERLDVAGPDALDNLPGQGGGG